jgi:formate hydrogenlyase subunit 6/NADH:ubiquinone oxidoreductase subunit I
MRRYPGKIIKEAMGNLNSKAATNLYPAAPSIVTKGYRGKLNYNSKACTGCKLCVRDCPAKAIEIVNVGADGEKIFECHLDLGHCIFCGQCADVCPKKCLKVTNEFELATTDKSTLNINLKEV